MQLTQVTRDGVLQAIAECDRLGRQRFLDDYGFREALEYYLLYGGNVYDSKAIVGVAYGFDTGTAAAAGDFSGGKVVADRLRELGFTVTGDMDWQWYELVVVADLLYLSGWQRTLRAGEEQVTELSRFLRGLRPELGRANRYRSPNSVQRKLEDLRTSHPGYGGQSTKGGRLTAQVAEAFLADPEGMHRAAQAVRRLGQTIGQPDPVTGETDDVGLAEGGGAAVAEAVEGRVFRRLVAVRERDPKLRQAKIDQSRAVRGHIACETCGFDFEAVYGDLGSGFIHVHHAVPLHLSGEVESGLTDLVLLCANCHQMIHRARPRWKTPDELRAIIETRRRR